MRSKKSASVESMAKELGITDIKLHKSDDDAWAVIRGLQVIGEKERLSLVDTINTLKKCNKNYHAEQAIERNRTLAEKAKSGNVAAQNKIIKNGNPIDNGISAPRGSSIPLALSASIK